MSCLIFNATAAGTGEGGADPNASSNSRIGSEDLIQLLFDKQDVKKETDDTAIWYIKNKYYSAHVKIIVKDSLENTIVSFDDDVRAVIYYGGAVGADTSW